MQIRPNRRTEREAVNAARAFFESCNCVFQEVNLENDFGKDAYIDFSEASTVTGFCVAVQIKGGKSFRRANGYAIPLDDEHARVWEESNLPIAGIVFDPDDKQLRWCNISEVLSRHRGVRPGSIFVSSDAVLTHQTFESQFKSSFLALTSEANVGRSALQMVDGSHRGQLEAVMDCLAFGRNDYRVLIILRYLLFSFKKDELFRAAVRTLAHVTPHPDIMWHKGNWIPEEVCSRVLPHFTWSVDETARLICSIDPGEMQRGCFGQDVYCLLHEDSGIKSTIIHAALEILRIGNEDAAFQAMYLSIYWAGRDGRQEYRKFIDMDSRFGELNLSAELEMILGEWGRVTLFE